MAYNQRDVVVDASALKRYFAVGILVFIAVVMLSSGTYIVDPGHRGVFVTMGKVSPTFAPEGFGFKAPMITSVIPVSVRQQTNGLKAECYSSDLQQVSVDLRVLFRLPESGIVKIYQDYSGDPFDSLIAPRVSEAIKEVTANQTAEKIVKNREEIKNKALEAARTKLGKLLVLEDLVIQNISLSKELEAAIEAKMVQEQEAAKARFIQTKTEIEASTAVIRAKGEAQAIQVRGQALRNNPALVQLQIVEKWDGKAPLVVGGSAGGGAAQILLPLGHLPKD
jgi:prohibitin 2